MERAAEQLNYNNKSYESWLYLVGMGLDRIGENAMAGIHTQRPRLMYLVSLIANELTDKQYTELERVAWGGNEKELYRIIKEISRKVGPRWKWNREEIEELVVPGSSLKPSP